jgi:hypothetical protein
MRDDTRALAGNAAGALSDAAIQQCASQRADLGGAQLDVAGRRDRITLVSLAARALSIAATVLGL